jgi:hypothetical protein
MNRTLKEATVKRYHYETNEQLKAHLSAFLMAYNFAKRLKTIRGLTPHEYVCKVWTDSPERFRLTRSITPRDRTPSRAKRNPASCPGGVGDYAFRVARQVWILGASPESRSGMVPPPSQLERHFRPTARALRSPHRAAGFRKQRGLFDRLCALFIHVSRGLRPGLRRHLRLSGMEDTFKEPGKQGVKPRSRGAFRGAAKRAIGPADQCRHSR